MHPDEALQRVDAAVGTIDIALTSLSGVGPLGPHLLKAIADFVEEAREHLELILILRRDERDAFEGGRAGGILG
jgi:hypothetical protein